MILTLACLVIAGVMLYLVKKGVSLRPALYIKPSPMTEGMKTVARDLSLRLFPEFQDARYVVWGIDAKDVEALEVLNSLKAEEERSKAKPVQILTVSDATTAEDLQKCQTPCWLLRPQEQAHELKPNHFSDEVLKPFLIRQNAGYFNLTIVPFEFAAEVPTECWAERRLDFECIQKVSVQATERKLPEEVKVDLDSLRKTGKHAESFVRGSPRRKRYFFLNKYNESDFFLFLEKPFPG